MRCMHTMLISVMLLAAGCGEEPAAPVADEVEIVYWSGDGQISPCYSELANPVVVRVLGDFALPAAGQAVQFRIVQGDGWVREGTATSDSAGFAEDYWTVGAPGAQVLEVRLTRFGGAREFARFTATAEATDVGERRIVTTDVPNPLKPSVFGDRAVYKAWRNSRYDVYLHDLSSETERRITTDAAQPYLPVIWEDRIAWIDWRNGKPDIYLYDLATGTERRITTDVARPSGVESAPALSGDRVVWTDSRNGRSDIYLYDLTTDVESRITTDATLGSRPAIFGDRIVWEGVYLYDIASATSRHLAPGSNVDIWGDYVVYGRYGEGGYWDVYLYDLNTDQEMRITTDASDPCCSSISGHRITWGDQRSGRPELYLYDLATGIERPLPTGLSSAPHVSYPDFSGDRIAWTDTRSGTVDLYLYDLASACVPPAATGKLR